MTKAKRRAKKIGTLILIGGSEDRLGPATILMEIARRVGEGVLVIATVASSRGDESWKEYRKTFKRLGVKHIRHLDVVNRTESIDYKALAILEEADAVFFTGGDQLKITSELGGTPAGEEVAKIYERGGVIAGTSAGASVMSDVMFVGPSADRAFRLGSFQRMAPGLGLVNDMIIDQHFVERGRIARLIGAVAQNPKFLGLGLDENTAIVMPSRDRFQVIGEGAVVVVDAHESTNNNTSEKNSPDTSLSIFNVRFHLLTSGDRFDITGKAPIKGKVA